MNPAAVLSIVALLLGSGESPAPSPSPSAPGEFFREDHGTGADYIALYPSGKYQIVGREHMGIFDLERGAWSRHGTILSFNPESGLPNGRVRRPYRGLRATRGTDVFLTWSTEDAAGIVIPERDVRNDLEKGAGHPPYVFFRVTEQTLRCETGVTYPFRFYPEMNMSGQLKCEGR